MIKKILLRLLIAYDVSVFCTVWLVGKWYSMPGPPWLVNGIVLYFFLIKRQHWAYICFGVLTGVGIFVAIVSIFGNIFPHGSPQATFLGLANVHCVITYVTTLLIGKDLQEEEENAPKTKKKGEAKKK